MFQLMNSVILLLLLAALHLLSFLFHMPIIFTSVNSQNKSGFIAIPKFVSPVSFSQVDLLVNFNP